MAIHGAAETGSGEGLSAGGTILISRKKNRPLSVTVAHFRNSTLLFRGDRQLFSLFLIRTGLWSFLPISCNARFGAERFRAGRPNDWYDKFALSGTIGYSPLAVVSATKSLLRVSVEERSDSVGRSYLDHTAT
jgi:hypothetical protein